MSGVARYTAGESCVLRGIVHHRVWLAQSVVVVKDTPEEVALLLSPGAPCAYPEGYWRWKRGDFSRGNRWQEAQNEIVFRQFTWQTNRILILLEPERYYSCFLFWEHATDRFACYYVNFQLPYRRSRCGFDTLDLDLDLVVEPDFSWHWKDQADYEEAVRAGHISPTWAAAIAQAQPEVLARIAARRYPFNDAWLAWRPDPAWAPPQLPAGWDMP